MNHIFMCQFSPILFNGRTDGRADRRTDGQTDGRTNGQTDGRNHTFMYSLALIIFVVSEKKAFEHFPIGSNVNLCIASDRHKRHKLCRGPSNDHSWAVWFQLSKWFQRRSVLKHFPYRVQC